MITLTQKLREELPWAVTMIAVAAFIVFVAWQVASIPSCEEKGGQLVQTGTRSESYVVTNVKVGEINVPIYGHRTVAVYDCLGDE